MVNFKSAFNFRPGSTMQAESIYNWLIYPLVDTSQQKLDIISAMHAKHLLIKWFLGKTDCHLGL